MKKEVKNLNETLSKYTNWKENFDLILSSQRPSFNKTRLKFKSGRTHSKGFNRKKVNRPIYKCSQCNRFDHLCPFCFDKLKRLKGSNSRCLITTNAPGPKKV